jgi:hypothetical protein
MQRVKLIHWKEEGLPERVDKLTVAGYEADTCIPHGTAFLKALEENPPAAVVIDLTRMPSQGRDLGILIRKRKGTRRIPLVFVGGASEKVARVKEILPDATYTSWESIAPALKSAIANPPTSPAVPESTFDAYKGKPLVEKLGIKADFQIALYGAPGGFERSLGKLPKGVVLHKGEVENHDLSMWFTRSGEALAREIKGVAEKAGQKPIWIAWPKKTSKITTDLSQQLVREVGLASGLVDYKICSIDDTWSGLLFKRR